MMDGVTAVTERIEAGAPGERVAFRLDPFRLVPSVEQVARYFGGARYAPKADARRRIEEGIRHALGLIEPAASLAFHVVAEAPCDGVLHLANGLSLDLPESLLEGPPRCRCKGKLNWVMTPVADQRWCMKSWQNAGCF